MFFIRFWQVLYSYSIGFIFILIGELLFDRVGDAVVFWWQVSGLLIFHSLTQLNKHLAKRRFDFIEKHPVETYGYSFIFSITGYMGINIVLQLVKHFGALLAVTGTSPLQLANELWLFLFLYLFSCFLFAVTTCRKAMTIALSFVFFAKPFTLQWVFLVKFSKNFDDYLMKTKTSITTRQWVF